ncbi:hypothetical protein KCU64_g6996, partial [Aureobasidium melanogenum]
MQPKDVHVRLLYLGKESQDSERTTVTSLKTKPACKTPTLNVLETIHDVRGSHEEFDLDIHGFRYIKAPSEFKDWASEQGIQKNLVSEVEDLLRNELEGCDELHIIETKNQQPPPEKHCSEMVHVDYTASSVESLVRQRSEIKADYLLAGRVRLINIWKPILCTVSRSPIAITDGREVNTQRDISKVDTGTPMRHGHYRDGYRWYYMSEQAEEDVLLFKTYDSDPSVPSTACFRTMFDVPNNPADTPPSRMVEIQALVFTHPVSKQVAHHLKTDATESLKRKSKVLSDELSHHQALVRAGLDLRQWESSNTAERMRHLISDRDHSRAEALSLSMQLNYLESWIMHLYMSCSSVSPYDPVFEQLQRFVCSTPRLCGRFGQDQQAYQSLVQSVNMYGPDAEILMLRQQLQAQYAENERLKVQMNARVEDKMNEAFDSALQLAVDHERGKDSVVIEGLRQEIQRLQMALRTSNSKNEDPTELAGVNVSEIP